MTKCLAIVMLMLAAVASAEVPHLINYQGRITDELGNPMDGSHTLTFRIYDDSTGGTTLWSETHVGVTVTDGLFDVVIGSIETIESSIFSSQPRWLGMRVDLGAELVPRTQIVAVAYAYRAEHADTADYAHETGGGGGGWIDDGAVVRLSNPSDYVGIGTPTPDRQLTVDGHIAMGQYDVTRYHMGYYNGGLDFAETNVADYRIFIKDGGNVGIGTGNPQERLHVNGDVRLGSTSDIAFGNDDTRVYGTTSAGNDLNLTADDDLYLRPDDDIFVRADASSTSWIHFDNSAEKLGVGVINPDEQLHVNGNAKVDGSATVSTDLEVNGAYKGNISSSSSSDGAPFPRPAYNSGWLDIAPDEILELTHDIGGDSNNYVVDLQFWSSFSSIHNFGIGGNFTSIPNYYGVHYQGLTSTSIEIVRHAHDYSANKIRVRIWVIE